MVSLSPKSVLAVNMAVTAITVAWVVFEHRKFRELVATIKAKFHSAHELVGSYKEIDEQI